MLPPVNVTDVAPRVAVTAPPQEVVAAGDEATTRPAGSGLVNETPVSGADDAL